jgi:DNA (cytosine-5)-methyltransferase 1
MFEITNPQFKITKKPIKLFEAFAGIGCQAMAFNKLGIEYESVGISEIDKHAIIAYATIHHDLIKVLNDMWDKRNISEMVRKTMNVPMNERPSFIRMMKHLDALKIANELSKNYGDICKMTHIPECDIFTWSFPCTDLSKTGKREGLQGGTRSGLVYEVLRLLQVSKPKVLIMENVPDLIQATFVEEFGEIRRELEELGYSNYVERLNAKDYGVAQNRDRVFMVSILGEWYYEFPQKIKLEKRLKDYLEDEVDEKYYISSQKIEYMKSTNFNQSSYDTVVQQGDIVSTICARDYKDPKCVQVVQLKGKHQESGRVYSDNGLSPTINTMQGGNLEPKVAIPMCLNSKVNGKQPSLQDRIYDTNGTSTAITTSFMPSIAIPEATKKGYSLASDGDGIYINRPHQKRGVVQKGMIQTLKTSGEDVGVVVAGNEKYISERFNEFEKENGYRPEFFNPYNKSEIKDIAPTITTMSDRWQSSATVAINHNLRIRKLTPIEVWRLMGISDEDFDKASKVVSNSQLYKQAGNGIVVDVFAAILRGLF